MKIYSKILPVMAAATMALSGCMEEVDSFAYVSKDQVEEMENAQEYMVNGLAAFFVDNNTWGATGSSAYYLNDFGYPAQMFFRNVLTDDYPISEGASFNYWMAVEQSTELRWTPYYTYNYYYTFAKNCNNLISVIDPEAASSESLHYLGCALAYRALCYFDMARLFEYKETGYATLDNAATADSVFGLTVPIATEDMTEEQLRNNPRVPFYTMYRFILSDLDKAEEYLEGFSRSNGNYPNQAVVYGLKARFWLELASRFENSDTDLQTQISHEGDEDGYAALGITTAKECYQKALDYAQKAQSGFTPMTKEEWTNQSTGFNTAANGWMLYCSVSTSEQIGYYYSSFIGTICTEAEWGMPQYGSSYRGISSYLYGKIDDNDWRKLSWISPDDAGNTKKPFKSTREVEGLEDKYQAAADSATFMNFPAYANLKFRTRSVDDMTAGMLCDIPLMRVEEMYFIEAEATAHINGYAAGYSVLKSFLDTYRYEDGAYSSQVSDIASFQNQLMIQKRIEFWGEGLTMFDMKRLNIPLRRSNSDNYSDAYQTDSKDNFVCPAMNYYLMDYAKNQNAALVLNPDCSGWYNLE